MSLLLAAAEIKRFLENSDPEVLCIQGRWGVGKTFAWNHYLEVAKTTGTVALKRYSYVSLFGQNSIEDVRNSVFENTVSIDKSQQSKVNLESIQKVAENSARKLAQIAKFLPQVRSYAPLGARLLFASLSHQIVCIDDLERAGKGISKSDVLGLISELKEQKSCKIVLLLNAEELGDDEQVFNAQIEKVADTFIQFSPTPEEAAEIGVDGKNGFRDQIISNVVILGITNIRVIKRIERLVSQLEADLQSLDARILKQAIQSATLFAFSKYQTNIAPSLEFIRTFNRIADMVGQNGPIAHPEWRAILADYNFGAVDDFDAIILQGIERGYFDVPALVAAGQETQRILHLQDQDNSMSAAWAEYHGSFDNDAETLLDHMYEAFKANVVSITPLNVSGAAKLFKELGRPVQSRELVEFYVQNRLEVRKFWDLDDYAFGGEITDPDVIELFNAKYASMAPAVGDPAVLLEGISRDRGWSKEDVEQLASLTVDDFFDLFKRLKGDQLRRVVREALRFGKRGLPGSSEDLVGVRANEALDRISAESTINQLRVRQRRAEV